VLIQPAVSVNTIPTQSAACGTELSITVTATVTDTDSGVASGSLAPTLWWRESTGTYAALLPSSVSGSTYTYTLNITGVAGGQTYHYYVAAQDVSGNIAYSHFNTTTPVHSDVSATPSPINGAPATFSISTNTPLFGTKTVGSGGDYGNFNNNTTGLFKAIADNGLSGNLIVEVISDVNESADYYPLSQWTEYCGTGYTITIRSSAATQRVIASNASGANGLIHLAGCKGVTIDGSVSGDGRYLLFRQGSTQVGMPPAIYMTAGTQNVTIENCIIEGNNTQTVSQSNYTGPGVINFGLMASGSSPITNITIDNNIIRNRSDLAQNSTNCPKALIALNHQYSTSTPVKSNITISNNELFNFQTSAIWAVKNSSNAGLGDNIIITGNKIYQPVVHTTPFDIIRLDDGGNAKGHIISNNIIGGNASPSPDITGTWTNYGINFHNGIVIRTSLVDSTLISGNTIQRFFLDNADFVSFTAIDILGGNVAVMDNTIGSDSEIGNIEITGSATGDWIYYDPSELIGINSASTGNQ